MAPTKKFINNPKEVVDDALRGLVHTNPGIQLHEKCGQIVLRKSRNEETEGKVALIAGGGSGHEPYSTGFVGTGMLTAAVAGSVFASPPSKHVLMALEASQTKAGSILFIINYTGDRLNFGLAAERYRATGQDVRVVTIGDDTAIDECENRVGRRGLAGAVLVIKVAGAMSEQGKTIDDIERMTNEMGRHIDTIGVSMAPCSIPGQGAMFKLEDDKMEVGLGIHGEAGKTRETVECCSKIVDKLMNILKSARDKRETKTIADTSVVIILNNLGSVSQIEICVLQGEILRWCDDNNLNVVRMLIGPYMTSLDGHGISITIMDVFQEDLLAYIDQETSAPGWIRAIQVAPKHHREYNQQSKHDQKEQTEPTKKKAYENDQQIVAVIRSVCETMQDKEDELNRLDGSAGDGDCGSTFRHAADAILKHLKDDSLDCSSRESALRALSDVFEMDVGGTSGAIYALLLSTLANNLKSDGNIGTALKQATNAIIEYGRARPGDRTMIDALQPAVDEISTQNGANYDWERVVGAAERGAEDTKTMKANAGRASYTSSDVQKEPDAGAMAIAYWMRAAWKASRDKT